MRKINKIISNYDFVFYPFITVFGFGFSLLFSPVSFIPDYLDLKSYTKTYELFNLIISSLVSLIGIYITVSLVAYEFFKQKSGMDFQKSFLVNRWNGYFISFTVFTILLAFIGSILVSFDNPTDNELTLTYYIAILFIGVILSLFPIAFNLFSSLRPEKVVKAELKRLDSKTIFIAFDKNDSVEKQTENIENDPLLRIENIVFALLTVKDTYKAISIIRQVT